MSTLAVTNTFAAVSTTLNGATAAGATSIVVTSATGMIVGDFIIIDSGASLDGPTAILTIVSNTITVAALTYAHSSGVAVATAPILSAASLDTNFNDVRTFLNGSIDATNLNASMKIGLGQLVESRNPSFVNFTYVYDAAATAAEQEVYFHMLEEADFQDMRINVFKTTAANNATVTMELCGADNAAKGRGKFVYDDNVAGNWGLREGGLGLSSFAGEIWRIKFSSITNLTMVTGQIRFVTKHTDK